MKKALGMLSALLLMSGCVREDDMIPQTNEELCEMSISMKGEILDVTEGPLGKAAESDLYGFHVYSKQDNGYAQFAYGLFNDMSDVKIKLIKGKTYRIVSTMVKNGVNVICGRDQYEAPFNMELENKFINRYAPSVSYEQDGFRLGLACLENGTEMGSFDYIPKVYRYFGESQDVVCDDNAKFVIEMKKVIFGAKFIVEGLTEGKVHIQLQGKESGVVTDTEIIEAGGVQEIDNIYTFDDFSDMEKIERGVEYTLGVFHAHEDGILESIAEKPIKFKRNKKTTVVIKIKQGADSTTKGNSVTVKLEEDNMTSGDQVTIG